MKLIKRLIKKIFKRFFHLEIKRSDFPKATNGFWTVKHPICVYDNNTGRENPIKEFQMVKQLLRNDRGKDYPDQNIEFGDFSYGNPKIWNWDKASSCKIGKYCSIAFGTTILIGGEHCMDWMTTYPFDAFINSVAHHNAGGGGGNSIHIGNDVWIGSDVKIMPNVIIGDGCVVGANSLVLKNTIIPDYTIWAGIPARQIRKRFSDDIVKQLKEMRWWDWPDEDICNAIPILQSNSISQLVKYYENNIKPKISGKL